MLAVQGVATRRVAEKISRAILNVFYARLLGKPHEGKWTKSQPVVDWLICQSVLTAGFPAKLADVAFKHIKLTVVASGHGVVTAFIPPSSWRPRDSREGTRQ